MFLSRNKIDNVYPFKPQFYYIDVGFKVVVRGLGGGGGNEIIQACFSD